MFYMHHHHGHPIVAIVIVVLVAAVLVLGILTMVRAWRSSRETAPPFGQATHLPPVADPALTELRIRFARGEITEEDYSRSASLLGYPSVPRPRPGDTRPDGQAPPASDQPT